MRKFLFIIIIFLTFLTTGLAENLTTAEKETPSHLRISLLTCSSGSTLSAAFGHSALRVCDSVRKIDLVFNYGTFDFNGLNFLGNFIMGKMNYFLSIGDFDLFTYHYGSEGRSIVEQELILTEQQKRETYSFLINNYKPQNRYYAYDFFNDNCATRIRDIFEGEDFTIYEEPTSFTVRGELKRSLVHSQWLMFGIDLLLGDRIDKKISTRQQMFLPDRLSENMSKYCNKKRGGAALLGKVHGIVSVYNERNEKIVNLLVKIFQPVVIFILLFLVYVVSFIKLKSRDKFVRIFRLVFYIILCAGGTLLAFMWFGTHHVWTKMNWNLLWMNPLYLLPLLFRSKKISAVIGNILAAISLLTLIFLWLIPQSFNPAAYFIMLLEIAVAFSYYRIVSNKNDNGRSSEEI